MKLPLLISVPHGGLRVPSEVQQYCVLTRDEIRELADGGIFVAEQAKEEDLIDDIGYLDDAVDVVRKMAKIGKARVVEYRRPFSLMDIMSYKSESLLKLDRSTLYELSSPQVLYLWTAY